MLRLVLGLLVTFTLVLAKHEIYDGFAVFEVTVENEGQSKFLNELQNEMNLDVWSHAVPTRPGTVFVSKEKKVEFADKLYNAGIQYVVETDNVKDLLHLEDAVLEAASKNAKTGPRVGLSFDTIHRYAVVDQYLVDLAAAYPDIVRVASGGSSIQGRDIKHLRISTSNFEDQSKPVVFLQSLLHAREWVTLPASLYAINKLVTDPSERYLIEDYDWVILPIANPDGYEFSHTNTRFWRKNRADGFVVGNLCVGVDLNRNFDVNWGQASSTNVCSDTFHGRGPFSEPEAAAIGSIMRQHGHRMSMFVDIHSFGSMILYGFGNGTLTPNALINHLAGVQMAQTIDSLKWPTNSNYIVGNVASVLYQASGSAGDYGHVTAPNGISYTFELPAYRNNQGLNGFLVDPEFIEQAGFETWEGIKTGARFAGAQWRNRVQN